MKRGRFVLRARKKSAGGQFYLQRSKGAQIGENAPLLLFYNNTNAQRLHNIMQHVHAYRHVSAFNAYNMPNRKPGLFCKTIQGPPAFCARVSDHLSHGGGCCFSSLFFCHNLCFLYPGGEPPPTLRPTLYPLRNYLCSLSGLFQNTKSERAAKFYAAPRFHAFLFAFRFFVL